MKRIYTILVAVLITASVFAQAPEKMSYQAVVRDASNNLITNQAVGMQISILQGGVTGTAVYIETQTPTTNANGLVSLEIGTGTTSDDFSAIDWANNTYFIKIETDPTGGINYTITSTSQLLSVPYALHAKTAENVTGGIIETDPLYTQSVASKITVSDTTNWSNKLDAEIDPAYTNSQAANITADDITRLSNLSGINTGDQDISGIATNQQAIQDTASQIRAEIPDVSGFVSTETDPVFTVSQANNITATDITNLSNLSGVNTGDQDLSGKVDIVAGKGLSTNDYTDVDKTKLSGIETGAQVNVKSDWNSTSGDSQILNKPDLSTYAEKSNVLQLDNTTAFTPDADYEPATKKYVDDNISSSSQHYIGEEFGGGIIYYVDRTGEHGLIVSITNISESATWGHYGDNLGANNIADGKPNYDKMLVGAISTDAAYKINEYRGGGYSDWYLPAFDEFALLYDVKYDIDNVLVSISGADDLQSSFYWLSTESSSTSNAYVYNMVKGVITYTGEITATRNSNLWVRAIRKF